MASLLTRLAACATSAQPAAASTPLRVLAHTARCNQHAVRVQLRPLARGCWTGPEALTSMRAAVVEGSGKDAHLTIQRVPVEAPQEHEIRIRVHAAGVNRPDLLQKRGLYPAPSGASPLLGLEVAGVVESVGTSKGGKSRPRGVPHWEVGAPVCALTNGGGYAELVNVHAGHVFPMPKGMSCLQAACLPETTLTVWNNVFAPGHLKYGDRLLVHGGASGIGTTAIQLARNHGVEVFATAGTKEKCVACSKIGANEVFDYTKADWAGSIKDAGGVDMILDMVGAPYLRDNLACLRSKGRLVLIGLQGGAIAQDVDLMRIMLKRLHVTGSTLRSQSDAEKSKLVLAVREHVWPMVQSGDYHPVMFCQFPMEEAETAHGVMENMEHIGKIALNVFAANEVPESLWTN